MVNVKKFLSHNISKNHNSSNSWTAFVISLIAIISIVIYSDTLYSPFHFDSKLHILDGHDIKSLKNFWPPSGSRYIGHLSFAVNYYFGGLNVIGYHIVNILIHILNGVMVYWLITLTFETPVIKQSNHIFNYKYLFALVVSLVFISHPIQTQSVTYVIQRFSSLTTFFYILSINLFINWKFLYKKRSKKKYIFYFFSLFSLVLSMSTKEFSFTLPIVIILYDIFFFNLSSNFNTRNITHFIPYLLSFAIIPYTIVNSNNSIGDFLGDLSNATAETTIISRYDYLITQFRVIVTYLRLLIFPVNQNLDYDYPVYDSFFNINVFSSFILLSGLFSLGVYLFINSRKTDNTKTLLASFGIFWFFITLSVESSFIPIQDVIFEHRVYLPSIGAIITFCSLVLNCLDLFKFKNVLFFYYLMFIAIVFLDIATFNRNKFWKSELTLWEDVISKSPNNPRAHYNLGIAYYKEKKINDAINEYKKAFTLKPNYAAAHYNLGIIYSETVNSHKAVEEYKEAIRIDPLYEEAHTNLGFIYFTQNKIDKAIYHYKISLKLKPRSKKTHNNLGLAYQEMDRLDDAIKEYKRSISLAPDYADPYNNLGSIYLSENSIDNSILNFKKAIRLKPDYAEAINNLGLALFKQGNIDDAIIEYKKAIKIQDSASAHSNLGIAYSKKGLVVQAMEEFILAAEANPNDFEVHFNLGNSYMQNSLYEEAKTEFLKSIELNTGFINSHFFLSITYLQMGDKKSAEYELKETLKLKPDHMQAANLLKKLN